MIFFDDLGWIWNMEEEGKFLLFITEDLSGQRIFIFSNECLTFFIAIIFCEGLNIFIGIDKNFLTCVSI